jgi:hypothetical protein
LQSDLAGEFLPGRRKYVNFKPLLERKHEMKPKTINGKWIALTTLVALFALATPALAWWGYGPGYGMMGGGAPGPNLTGTQQKQVSAIQSKYQSQLDAL